MTDWKACLLRGHNLYRVGMVEVGLELRGRARLDVTSTRGANIAVEYKTKAG